MDRGPWPRRSQSIAARSGRDQPPARANRGHGVAALALSKNPGMGTVFRFANYGWSQQSIT